MLFEVPENRLMSPLFPSQSRLPFSVVIGKVNFTLIHLKQHNSLTHKLYIIVS